MMIKMRLLAAAMVIGLMLTGCSETVEEEITHENSDALIDYSTEMEGYMNEFSGTMQEFSDLNMAAAQNPSIMSTNDWIIDVTSSLISMEEHIADIRAVDPPEEMKVSHTYVLKAMDNYEYAVENYPDALEDSNLLNECIAAMEEGGRNLEKAIEETSKVTY